MRTIMSHFLVHLNAPPQKVFLLRRDRRRNQPASQPASLFLGRVQSIKLYISRLLMTLLPSRSSSRGAKKRHARCLASSRRDNRDGVRFTRASRFSEELAFHFATWLLRPTHLYSRESRRWTQSVSTFGHAASGLKVNVISRRLLANKCVTRNSRNRYFVQKNKRN